VRSLSSRSLGAIVLAGAAIYACAQPSPPPGGPPDSRPPVLLSVSPESGTVRSTPDEVRFQFDEVVSERPQGAADLKGLFLVSPRDGEPNVRWRRDAITVKPHGGWRPNTVYTITMLPGLTDLRGNINRSGAVVAIATGADFPRTLLAGRVFDWAQERIAGRAMVEAINLADSTTYVAAADSTGGFAFHAIRPGRYAVLASIDANSNRRRDAREPWDSTLVSISDTSIVELLAIAHDTIGPRISQVAIRDSLTLRVTFDQALAPTAFPVVAQVRLTRSDSTRIAISQLATVAEYDRRQREIARAKADSLRKADTTRRDTIAPPPTVTPVDTTIADSTAADTARAAVARPSRPAPPMEVVVELAEPLEPSSIYRLRFENVQGLLGRPRSSERVFTTPKPAPRDTAARQDTTAGRDTMPVRNQRAPSPTPPAARDTVRQRSPSDTTLRPGEIRPRIPRGIRK
jgi:hypothetical protein